MTSQSFNERILIVEDEADWRALIEAAVAKTGLASVAVASGEEALAELAKGGIFLLLADLVMPGLDGLELCRRVRAKQPDLPFVLVSGRADRDRAIAGLRAGVTDIVDKPFHADSLATLVRQHAARRQETILSEQKEATALLAIFMDEARDQLLGVDEALLKLEEAPGNKSEIDRLFRKIHTIKGSSGSVKQAEVLTPLAHAIETLLSRLKDDTLKPTNLVVDALLAATDLLSAQLKTLESGGVFPPSQDMIARLQKAATGQADGAGASARQPERNESRGEQDSDGGVYVPTDKLDAFMEMVGELIAVKNSFNMFCREPGYLSDAALTTAKDVAQTLDKVSDRIQIQLMEIRRVPLKKMFAKLPRIVRQVSAELQKDVVLEILGEDVSVDKSIANLLSGCLSHAVRNSLDHGLERTDVRVSRGKSAKGVIRVKAEDLSDWVRISVSDDGGGIDKDRVLARAINQGLVTAEEAARLSDDEIYKFIFRAGFSTAAQVTNISGRGVGMDAIQTAIVGCGGTTLLESKPGEGTTLTMSIPVLKSINVERSILLESRGTLYAVPLKSVSSINTVRAGDVTPLKSFLSFQYRGRATRMASYGELTKQVRGVPPTRAGEDDKVVVVINNKTQHFGLSVDRVIGQFDAVIRPFNSFVSDLKGFEGTAVVGNGKIAYVIAADEMVGMANEGVA